MGEHDRGYILFLHKFHDKDFNNRFILIMLLLEPFRVLLKMLQSLIVDRNECKRNLHFILPNCTQLPSWREVFVKIISYIDNLMNRCSFSALVLAGSE